MQHVQSGATNLLENAVGAKSGESILILVEKEDYEFYDVDVLDYIVSAANLLGIDTIVYHVDLLDKLEELSASILRELEVAKYVLFLARLGDSIRFKETGSKMTMCYAYTREILSSEFCTVPHDFMKKLYSLMSGDIARAKSWKLKTGDGFELVGDIVVEDREPFEKSFSVSQFPICTIPPVRAANATGEVEIAKWIVSTGNRLYEHDTLNIGESIVVSVKDGYITDFHGKRNAVDRIRAHYEYVGNLFSIDPYFIHSWHTGIHPKCSFLGEPESNLVMWGASVFANPRYTHFHTCGNYAPGEICLSVFDATIYFDNDIFWDKGHFLYLQRDSVVKLLNSYGLVPTVFSKIESIGID